MSSLTKNEVRQFVGALLGPRERAAIRLIGEKRLWLNGVEALQGAALSEGADEKVVLAAFGYLENDADPVGARRYIDLSRPDASDPQRGRLDLSDAAILSALLFWRACVIPHTKSLLSGVAVPPEAL